jgi:hypothetical protein
LPITTKRWCSGKATLTYAKGIIPPQIVVLSGNLHANLGRFLQVLKKSFQTFQSFQSTFTGFRAMKYDWRMKWGQARSGHEVQEEDMD